MGDFDDDGMADPEDGDAPTAGAPLPEPSDADVFAQVAQDVLRARAKLNPVGGPQTCNPVDPDTYAEVLRDVQKAQANPSSVVNFPQVAQQPSLITGPVRTSLDTDALQNFYNAQAGLKPVQPQPETWLVNGQPYHAISADAFDPARFNGVTSMPTPEDSAAAVAGMSRVAVPSGSSERAGYIAHDPSSVVAVQGTSERTSTGNIYRYYAPAGLPKIHGHIDSGPEMSVGMVDSPLDNGGLGDSYSLNGQYPAPLATVSHSQVGWHVLDNGRLKFLYPQGAMTDDQIGAMQDNLNKEQQKFLRPQ